LIFGDNIENKLGNVRYFFFYIIVGLLASLAHIFATFYFGADMLIPTLGASGAISGVLGGYMMLYPGRKVKVIIFYFVTQVPAIVAIGLWFVFQLISGLGALGAGSQSGGVAYGAHIGGFIAGFVLIRFFAIGKK
jgi:membrane associated rhomboid family serine protease